MGACASCAAPSAAAGEDALRRGPASAVPAPLGPPGSGGRRPERRAAPVPETLRASRASRGPPGRDPGPPGDDPEGPRTRSDRRAEVPRTRSGSSGGGGGGGGDDDDDEDAPGPRERLLSLVSLAPPRFAPAGPPGNRRAGVRRRRGPDSDDAEQTKAKIYADLMAFKARLPRRDRGRRASRRSPRRVCRGAAALAKLFEDALLGRRGWASAPAASALLADDVTYRTMDGKVAVGKAEAIDKLNEAVAKLATRMRRGPSGAGNAGNAGDKKKTSGFYAPSVRSDGPRRSGEKEGTWVMTHVFSMLLMKVKIREEFRVDERGKIVELTRTRM